MLHKNASSIADHKWSFSLNARDYQESLLKGLLLTTQKSYPIRKHKMIIYTKKPSKMKCLGDKTIKWFKSHEGFVDPYSVHIDWNQV